MKIPNIPSHYLAASLGLVLMLASSATQGAECTVPEREKESSAMEPNQARTVSGFEIPAIDEQAPARLETATFAMG
jgi:hypothetical protein